MEIVFYTFNLNLKLCNDDGKNYAKVVFINHGGKMEIFQCH